MHIIWGIDLQFVVELFKIQTELGVKKVVILFYDVHCKFMLM